MPQLSPMMGFIIFICVLSFYLFFLVGVSKKSASVLTSKPQVKSGNFFIIFKLWNGSKMPKL